MRRPLLLLTSCLVAGLAALELHRAMEGIEAVRGAVACIAFGAAEYTSLVFAGVMHLEDALRVMQAHARALEQVQDTRTFGDSNRRPHPHVVAAVQVAVDAIALREPRIQVFAGTTGLPYDSMSAIRKAWAAAACSGLPSSTRRKQVLLAVEQQGYSGLVELGSARES